MQQAQALLVQAMHDLEPPPYVPPHARSRRLHQILVLRYLEGLTQDKVAQRLGITVRHLAREQVQAVNMLAERLWERRATPAALVAPPPGPSPHADESKVAEATQRHAQVESELASLRESAPGRVAEVGPTLREVAELTEVLVTKHAVRLIVAAVSPGTLVALHPSVLRQVVVVAITYLVRAMQGGEIHLEARQEANTVQIGVRASPATAAPPLEDWLGRQLVLAQGGSLRWEEAGVERSLRIALPAAQTLTVLVVDDNEDLVHFYRLCLAGTPYQMVHLSEGRRLFAAIEEHRPAVIVLDIMLPDVDGWELLAQLHQHTLSRHIPVIVCSVVREEELAFALGAAVHVSKPVRRQQFLEALAQALSQAGAKAPPEPESSATPY
jgi:CheY-like chemotaxis protein